jgi:hypothetical protein
VSLETLTRLTNAMGREQRVELRPAYHVKLIPIDLAFRRAAAALILAPIVISVHYASCIIAHDFDLLIMKIGSGDAY